MNKNKYSTHYTYKVNKEYEEENVYSFLEKEYNYSSRTFRYIIKEGKLLINDKPAWFIDILKEGDIIKVYFPCEKPDASSNNIFVNVIYEDDDFLVVNKEPGRVVHITKSHPFDTLQNGIYFKWEEENKRLKTRFVNRLDMDTSGIVVIAKNKYIHHHLQDQNLNNIIDKKYILIVKGILDKKQGVIDAPIGRVPSHTLKRMVSEEGKPSKTEYRVLKENDNHSLVEVKLITGRTHQIRVHFSYIGHPIVGDVLYNEEKSDIISHQALHAKSICFTHPRNNDRVMFEANPPDDFCRALDYFGLK